MSSTTLTYPQIRYFKLITGEDIIVKVLSPCTKDSYTITETILIQKTFSDQTGQLLVGFMPWTPTVEMMFMEYSIHEKDILLSTSIENTQIKKRYEDVIKSYEDNLKSISGDNLKEHTWENEEEEEEEDDYETAPPPPKTKGYLN